MFAYVSSVGRYKVTRTDVQMYGFYECTQHVCACPWSHVENMSLSVEGEKKKVETDLLITSHNQTDSWCNDLFILAL